MQTAHKAPKTRRAALDPDRACLQIVRIELDSLALLHRRERLVLGKQARLHRQRSAWKCPSFWLVRPERRRSI
jgi:hypothetical protein